MAMCSHNSHGTGRFAAGRKVAVLDGAYPTRFRIAQLLSPYHLTVEECGSLKEFFTPSPLQKSDTGIFVDDAALFIIGLNLPDGDGLDAVEWLKNSSIWKASPVVVLASRVDRETFARGMQLGCTQIVLKPINEEDLTARVLSIVGHADSLLDEQAPVVTHNLSEIISREVSRAKRTETPVSVLIAGFAGEGDDNEEVPREPVFARCGAAALKILKGTLREIDTLVPFGSCAIVAVLPLTAEEGAARVEERIREACGPLMEKAKHSKAGPIRLVVGSASYPKDAETWPELVNRARERFEGELDPTQPKGQKELAEAA